MRCKEIDSNEKKKQVWCSMRGVIFFFFKQKTAYEILAWLEFRRVLFRSTLRKIRKFTNPENLVKVYKSVIEPYFDYCSIVWDTLNLELADKLQSVQNRAARIITGATYNIRSKEVLEKLEWLPLKQRRIEQKAIMMYKIVNNLAPKYMVQMFESNHGFNYYNLRNSKNSFQLSKWKTEYYGKCFAISGAKVWSSFPENLKDAQSLKPFKKQLRKHLHSLIHTNIHKQISEMV